MIATYRKAAKTLLMYTLLLWAGHAALAADHKLSVLSSLGPGTRFHLGVSTLDKAFDKVTVFVSFKGPAEPFFFQGVEVVVDPYTMKLLPFSMLTAQIGAKPGMDESDAYKWYYNTILPSDLASGQPIRIQALLTSSQDPSLLAITNGVIGQTATQSPTEKRYVLRAYASNGEHYLHLDQIDVDLGTITYNTVQTQMQGSGAGYKESVNLACSPQISEDGNTALIPMRRQTSHGILDGQIYVLDIPTGTGAWLPTDGRIRTVPRFLTGYNDRFWILEETLNVKHMWAGGTFWDYDAVLNCYENDAAEGFPLISSLVLNDDPEPPYNGSWDYIDFYPDWIFDGKGQYAYFFTNHPKLTNGGPLDMWVFSVVDGAIDALIAQFELTSLGDPAWWRSMMNIPGYAGMLGGVADYSAGGIHHLYGFDGGIQTAPFLGNPSIRICGIARDGSWALLDQDGSYNQSALEFSRPWTNGNPMGSLTPLSLSGYPNMRDGVVQGSDSVLVRQNRPVAGYPLERIERIGSELFDVEKVAAKWVADYGGISHSVVRMDEREGCTFIRDGGGYKASLRNHDGFLAFTSGNYNQFGYVAVFDAQTMTHCFRLPLAWSTILFF